jgi:hypothetical protein
MITDNNVQQGNRGGQEYGEGNFHKSSRNQDSQRHEATQEEEKNKQTQEEEKFSPGEDEEYDAEDFATD